MSVLQVEVLNPCNNDLHFAYSVFGDDGSSPEDNEISGLHLFRKQKEDQTERYETVSSTNQSPVNFLLRLMFLRKKK